MVEQFSLFGEAGNEDRPEPSSLCGACRHFGTPDENNFGPCTIDAYGDGFVLNRRYKAKCEKYAYEPKKMRALSLADDCGRKW